MQTEIDYQRRDGRVHSNELRDRALRKDRPPLDIYEAHEQKQIAQSSDKLAVGQMAFSVPALATFDYFADGFGIRGTTVLQALVASLGMFSKPAFIGFSFWLLLRSSGLGSQTSPRLGFTTRHSTRKSKKSAKVGTVADDNEQQEIAVIVEKEGQTHRSGTWA